MAILDQPSKEPPQRNLTSIDSGSGLSKIPAQVIPTISDVTGSDSFKSHRFTIGVSKPLGELSLVMADCFQRVGGVVS